MTGGYPFHWTVSTDNGASWGQVQFPIFSGRPGGYGRRQPINAAFRGPDRTIYVAFDGWGSTCGLWASSDEGRTWFDTGGRTFGLHSTFVLLDDSRILAYVTRNRDILIRCCTHALPIPLSQASPCTLSSTAWPSALASTSQPLWDCCCSWQ